MGATITNKYSRKDYYFKNFETKEHFVEVGKKDCKAIGVRYDGANINSFKNQPLLQKAIAFFEDLMMKIDMGGAFEKARLITTEDQRGIFDFGLASKGLYRLQEYYSPELRKDSPIEFPLLPPGVVEWEKVDKDAMGQFWYTSEYTKKKYILQLRQEGTTEILEHHPNTPLQEIDGMVLPKENMAGLQYATSIKKSYLMFQKKGGKAKMVDLYIPFSASGNLDETGMLSRILPMILVAKYLEKAQIRTRISVARMYQDGGPGGKPYVCFTYPIKEYGDDVDFDYMAANSAEPTWFRGDLWKYIEGILSKETGKSFSGYGYQTTDHEEVLEVFNRYKNWYFEDMKLGNQQQLRVDRNLMLAGGLQQPSNEFDENVSAIKKEFFRILDIVDFQFNKPEKAAERIFRRMVVEEKRTISTFKSYVQSTLGDAYSYPTSGQYATEQEQRDKLEDGYDKAMEGLNKYLQSK